MRKTCEACGKVFYTLSLQQKYCFDCKYDTVRNRKKKQEEFMKKQEVLHCPVCGEAVHFPHRVYCSDKCREENVRKRRRKRYLEHGEERCEYQRDYYWKNREKINERARQKRKEFKEAQQNEEGH